jgi:hypothetical protein
VSTGWPAGSGPLGRLDPLLGAWVAEGETATGTYRCERRFDRVLHASHVQCVVTWILPGRDHEELAVFGADAGGELRMWSFTSDGRQSVGRLAGAADLPQPNIAFEADMPSGLARFAYWPEPGGLRFVVEAQAGGGWTRFLEHQYVPLD